MGDEDEDRAAILRRRQRMIALALSGLGVLPGCESEAVAPAEPPGAEAPSSTGPPMQPNDPEVDVGSPPGEEEHESDETEGTDERNDAEEIRHAEERKRENRPQPCLRVRPQACLEVRPQPCLSPMPRPCLNMLVPDPDDD